MQKFLALAAVALFALPVVPQAANVPRSDSDCAELLERWSTDPKAAPKSVIDACKEQLAAAPAGAADSPSDGQDGRRSGLSADEPARTTSLDPCSGPDAANSVLCWGPWANIRPAAGGPALGPQIASIRDPETRPETAEQFIPTLEPALPENACPPGTPCGFATIVSGFTDRAAAEDTEFGRFTLAADGTQFSVAPESGGDISSLPMTTTVTPRPDGYGMLRSRGTEGDVNSRLIARVKQDGNGGIQLAADIWRHGTLANGRSGNFAWGTTTSQAGLDTLNAGNVSLNFSGPLSVDNATTGNLTVNFGATPTWTGTWTNPAWSFGAGGAVTGANLNSAPGQFTNNVTGTGNFVQGALVGEQGGPRGITHIIDVTLAGQGRIKDVGLLPEVVGP